MTMFEWLISGFFVFVLLLVAYGTWDDPTNSKCKTIVTLTICFVFIIVVCICVGFRLYSTKKVIADNNSVYGLNRTITVYTADGEKIVTYKGKIDIKEKGDGYLLFDYKGKEYRYYNCFVESIAEIE